MSTCGSMHEYEDSFGSMYVHRLMYVYVCGHAGLCRCMEVRMDLCMCADIMSTYVCRHRVHVCAGSYGPMYMCIVLYVYVRVCGHVGLRMHGCGCGNVGLRCVFMFPWVYVCV